MSSEWLWFTLQDILSKSQHRNHVALTFGLMCDDVTMESIPWQGASWYMSFLSVHECMSRACLHSFGISFPRSADADRSMISGGSFAQLVVEDDDIISH